MSYVVKEIFPSLQGEGGQQGRAAVFCRFAGCNLWSGREADRVGAICQFCDTDFVGGVRYADEVALAGAIEACWAAGSSGRFVVFTGGEPLLQLDGALLAAVHSRGFEAAVETNGTIAVLPGVDWVCVSPKAGAPLAVRTGDELKVVFPQAGLDLAALARLPFGRRWLSPMDGPEVAAHTAAAADYCLTHPEWRLNIQAHKVWGVR